jgi:hypothetical protein
MLTGNMWRLGLRKRREVVEEALVAFPGSKPEWLTFDCYGTLIQWDEGLAAVVHQILERQPEAKIDASTLIHVYDRHEHALEDEKPHRLFKEVAGIGLKMTMEDLGLAYSQNDIDILTGGISKMPPFPEVIPALRSLKGSRVHGAASTMVQTASTDLRLRFRPALKERHRRRHAGDSFRESRLSEAKGVSLS